jgi:hypothetical protein
LATTTQTQTGTAHKRHLFDPERLAYLEVAGLRAYYDHKWFLMLRLVLQLMHEQFGLSWLRAVQAAYYTTRASVAWAPKDNDPGTTRRFIRKFYKCAAKYGTLADFDPTKVGDLEFIYWDLHRQYSGKPENEKEAYIDCLVNLHSILFSLPADAVRESAIERARGTDAIDLVTGKRSVDIEGDWRRAEEHLGKAYRSVVDLMAAQ